jgi:hypothetical protein
VTYFALKFLEHMSLDGTNMGSGIGASPALMCLALADRRLVNLPAPTRTQLQEIYKVRTLCLKALEHHAADPDVCLMGARLLERVAHNGTRDCVEVNGRRKGQVKRYMLVFDKNRGTAGLCFQACFFFTTAALYT